MSRESRSQQSGVRGDETCLQDALWCIEKAEEVAKGENDMGICWCARRWLKFLPERFNLQPKQERNEEDEREKFLVRCKSRDMFFKVGDIRLAYKANEPSTGYFVYLNESNGSDVMSYDERKFNKHFEIIKNI